MRMGLMAAVVGVAGSLAMGGGNAALAYYRAWNVMDSGLQSGLLSDDDEFRLSEDGAKRLAGAQDTVERLIEASASGDADWDIAYEEGPMALLPHLGLMRASSRVVGYDALRCATQGDAEGAAVRMASLYRMSGDVSHDRNVISSMVGMAIGNLANKLTSHFLDTGLFDADDAAVVLTAILELHAEDRYGMRDSIVGEWRMIGEFLVAKAPEQGAGKWLLETVQMDIDDDVTKQVAQMDKAALMRDLGGWSAFYGDMLGAWDTEDRGRMDGVVERLVDGEYGTLSMVMAPGLRRAFDSNQRSKEDFKALIGKLEGIAG